MSLWIREKGRVCAINAVSPSFLAQELCAPEGPTLGPDGWILNVCSITRQKEWPTRGGDITATRIDQPFDTRLLANTSIGDAKGIPAALAFGPDGALYVTDEGRRAIVRIAPDGQPEDYITHWGDVRLNGPNDLSFDGSGFLYFTDPWTSSPANPIGGVYQYEWETGVLQQIDHGLQFPNGIVARGDRLYVAETYTRIVWLHDISKRDGHGTKFKFVELPEIRTSSIQGPDGMACDTEGNILVTHFASGEIFVYSPSGNLVERIRTGGRMPTNVCFIGEDLDLIAVTVDDLGLLVTIPYDIKGDRLFYSPTGDSESEWTRVLEASPRVAEFSRATEPSEEVVGT